MTLLMASVGFATQSASATWWFPRAETRKIPHCRPRDAILKQVDGARSSLWLWTLGSVLSAFIALGLASFLGDARTRDDLSLPGPTSPPRRQPEPAIELQMENLHSQRPFSTNLVDVTQSLPAQKNPFVAIDLAYQSNLSERAKSLLDNDKVAMLDWVRDPSPALDLRIELRLPSLSFSDAPSRPASKRRSVGIASRLARLTVYWPDEGDHYTQNRKSSSGARLRDGHCAVDPKVIPYGSVVNVPGIGSLTAVDTGSAVMSRRAARLTGRTREQRSAIVIDVFCSSRSKARALVKRIKHFAVVTWQRPRRPSGL
jgi:3D (Asp-Asp-Asp) domain-containing protein